MKRLAMLLLIFLLLPACSPAAEESVSGGGAALWFAVSRDSARSDSGAIAREERAWTDAPTAQELMEALLDGPQTDGLYAPFPGGVSVRAITFDTENNTVLVDLTEQYGGLAGYDLTLADYCITLTLCQLPGIKTVVILVEGEPIPYRERQELHAEDVLLPGFVSDPEQER